jgi:hypothetical protein
MLNGIDPIIIFNLKKLPPSVASTVSKIPVVSSIVEAIDLPLIPIYLSERLTGIYIDTEDKNVDIETNIETLTDGSAPNVNQRGIGNTVKIKMQANRDSIGVSLFSALSDLVFPKVTSKEYSITYLHGAVTVFGGLLHSFALTQNANNDLYDITLELIKPPLGAPKSSVPVVEKTTGAVPL